MSIDIRLKHSSVQGKVPSPADLELGELALNVHENSPAAYIKDTAGNIVNIADQGGIPEAPEDGQQYARQNAAWSVVQGGGDGDVINYNGAAAWAHTAESAVIFSSLNIASVDKLNTGVYEYKFITPMPDATYSIVHSINTNNASSAYTSHVYDETAFGFKLRTVRADNYLAVDIGHSFAIHATNALAPIGGTGSDGWARTTSAGVVEAPSFNLACNRTSVGCL